MTLKINTTDTKDLLEVLKKLDEAGLIDRVEHESDIDKLLSDPNTFKIHPVPFPVYPYNPGVTWPVPEYDRIVITCTTAALDSDNLILPNKSTLYGDGM